MRAEFWIISWKYVSNSIAEEKKHCVLTEARETVFIDKPAHLDAAARRGASATPIVRRVPPMPVTGLGCEVDVFAEEATAIGKIMQRNG